MTSIKLKFPGVFITATDTNVGKTTVAAALAGFLKNQGLDIGVMKPVASGAIEHHLGKLISKDAEILVRYSGSTDPWEWINPYCLAHPVAPSLAAEIERVTIDFEEIKSRFRQISKMHEFVIVEGAGGVMSPIFQSLVVADLIKTLRLPAIIVSLASLGTINHTLMTFECLRIRQIQSLGFFFNRFPRTPDLSESTNAEIIASLSGVPHLGSVPELGDFFSPQALLEAFSNCIWREKLLEALGG